MNADHVHIHLPRAADSWRGFDRVSGRRDDAVTESSLVSSFVTSMPCGSFGSCDDSDDRMCRAMKAKNGGLALLDHPPHAGRHMDAGHRGTTHACGRLPVVTASSPASSFVTSISFASCEIHDDSDDSDDGMLATVLPVRGCSHVRHPGVWNRRRGVMRRHRIGDACSKY